MRGGNTSREMAAETEQEYLLIRYLLGESTEEERTQIEQRFLSDNDYFEQLLALEEMLVDQSARGNLSTARQKSFKRSSVSERKRNVEDTKQLLADLRARKRAAGRTTRPRNSIFEWRYLVPALAVMLLVVVPWLFVLSLKHRSDQTQEALNEERRRANESIDAERRLRLSIQEELENRSNVGGQEGGNLLCVRLQPYREERSGSGSELSVIKSTGLFQVAILELSLGNQRRFKSYQVKIVPIEDGGPVVVSGLMPEKDVSILKVPIAVNGLTLGDYNLSLSGEDDNNVLVALDVYSFRISSSR